MNKDQLIYWIREREKVRIAKEEGKPKPWSDNWVFQETYFCNVRREDDKTTKWIRDNYQMVDMEDNYELSICAARIFNWPDTLRRIETVFWFSQFDDDLLDNILCRMQDANEQIWSGAYVITTHGRKMPKIQYCVEILEHAFQALPVSRYGPATCQHYYKEIMELEGFGSFLAAQVVADLKNTKEHPLYRCKDSNSFSAPGPGSLRGLGWFHETKVTPSTYHKYLDDARGYLARSGLLEEIWLDNQDLQNTLCEFDKFMRVTNGTGRSKRKYDGA